MEASIKDGKLTLVLPIVERISASGKTKLIASTGGFSRTALKIKDEYVSVNVVATIPNPEVTA